MVAYGTPQGVVKSALITGGAGFIGSNLADTLLADGVDVRILDDFSSGYRANLERVPTADVVEGSVTDPASVDAAMDGCDTVFHLAASVGNKRSIDDPLHDARVNVLGTLEVLEAMRRHDVRTIVTSSSAGIFGELKMLPIAEDHPIDPDSPYGTSKLASEKAVLVYAKLHGISGVALRYFNVYGPHQRFDQYGNVIPIFVFGLLRNEPITIFGDGEQTRDFIHVDDVVQANIKAAQAGVSGAFNVASGSRVTINRLASMIGALVGGEPQIEHGSPRPGDVRHSLADIAAARSAFGFDPTVALDDGLAGYVAWAREESARVSEES